MSFIDQIPLLDEREFPLFAHARQQFGFVPNFYRIQTLRPDLIQAQIGLVDTLLFVEGALSRTHKEYVFLVCSAANYSTYCVTAHCEIVRALGLKGPEPDAIAWDHRGTDLPAADKALLDFALKLNNDATRIRRADLDALRAQGFNDGQILEAVLVAGLARFANLVSAGLGAEPDFEPPKRPATRA